jgi:hypothetical protein
LDTLPALAVTVSVCVVVTEATVAVNVALDALVGTVTVAGTVTAALLLERLTANPPVGAAAVNVTVHASDPDPDIDEVPQVSPLNAAMIVPVPDKGSEVVVPLAELLEMESCPVTAPAVAGSNRTLRLVVWPGVKVRGKVAPEIEKPVPATVAELTMSGAVPVEDRTTD